MAGHIRKVLLLAIIYVVVFLRMDTEAQAVDKVGALRMLQDLQFPEDLDESLSWKYSREANSQLTSLISGKGTVPSVYELNQRTESTSSDSVITDEDGDVWRQSVKLSAANYNVSDLCLNHTLVYLESLFQRQPWALSMLDAAGKIPSGILLGNLVWRGGYDECLNVTAVVYNNETGRPVPSYPFKGKYCQVIAPLGGPNSTVVPAAGGVNGLFGATPTLTIGVCLPSSCSGDDLIGLVNSGLSVIPVKLPNVNFVGTCQEEKDIASDGKAIAVIILASILGVLVILGTGFDLIKYQLPSFLASLPGTSEGLINGYGHMSNGNADHMGLAPSEKTSLLSEDKVKQENHQGKLEMILLAFSIYSNAKKILSTKQGQGTLTCINGIRFLSMTWVLLGHTYVFGLGAGDNIGSFLPAMVSRFSFQAIINGTVSVDSFFLLSGLLVGYLTLKELDKGKGRLNWGMFYFHRFWRLTPPYMLVLMVYVPLFKYWSSGPTWPQNGIEINECKNSWWTNLLYINNLVRIKEMCMGWSWYLANDMQFYVISPLILLPLYYSFVAGAVIILVLLVGTSLATALLSNYYHAGGGLTSGALDYFEYIYIKPYCRIGPYLIGLLVGYALFRTRCKPRMTPLMAIVGWICAFVCCFSVLYGMYDTQTHGLKVLTQDVGSLYNALNRIAWGVGLGWVIFACVAGYGGFINTFLSWKAFIPLSRLTYCGYLVHPIIMYLYYNSVQTPFHFTDLTIIYLFFGHLVLSYMTAFVVSLVFESPMMGLEKVIFKRDKRS